ncbi:MAG: B12-binding domain-containing radical SAM protein [Kiloniellaceae bacterium]
MKQAFSGVATKDLEAFPRDTSRPVLLVGFLDQGNLGLGYLTATLRAFGYRVIVTDVERPPEEIAALARAEQPLVVGLSLIFQFYIGRYAAIVHALRDAGVDCHITIGGHFPSLSPAETLKQIPAIDSVVRFEGESTLLELADRLGTGGDWRAVGGLVYGDGENGITETPPRHLLHDLDELPWPTRDYEAEQVLGRRAMPLLASRGCARTCSFCSIHTFYRAAPGKVVRTRDPAAVVEEMRWLHDERGVTIFLFQDDDFPLFGRVWQRWTRKFVAELHKAGLPGRAIWKINCRADAVDEELFREMQAAGLYLVYMGLESGDADGLETLNKGITVEQNLKAVATLKRLGLVFEFGFMLLDPSSSFESVRTNLGFLRAIAGDGSVAAVFCRMLPYDGTPIKDRLAAEGRLKGDICNPDYDFLDPRLDAFYRDLNDVLHVSGWIHGHQALSPALNWAWNEVAILERLFPGLGGLDGYKADLRKLTAASNDMVLDVVEDLVAVHAEGRSRRWRDGDVAARAETFGGDLLRLRDGYIQGQQDVIIAALQADGALAAE